MRLIAIAWMAALLASATALAADKAATITLASYNILADRSGAGWSQRSATVNRYLANAVLDIVALQEVTERQMGDIARSNPQFSYVVGERSDGMRGDQGWYEYNPILFRADRFTLVDAASFWVSDTPTKPGSILPGTKRHGRIFTWARLRDTRSGVVIFIGNVHLHGLRGDDEIKIVMARLSALGHRGPAALLGDFNAVPGSAAVRWITAASRSFTDAAIGSTDEPKGTVIGPDGFTIASAGKEAKLTPVAGADRIDYILTCGLPATSIYQVTDNLIRDGVHASDHKPIHATYSGIANMAADCLGLHQR